MAIKNKENQNNPQMETLLRKIAANDDLSFLTEQERGMYYEHVCQEFGLNPATKPFSYITFENGKTVLYAMKNATDQLRIIHGVSVTITSRERFDNDVYIVVAKGRTSDGREDESIGASALADWQGDRYTASSLANAIMHAETKAKRRVTLSLCGVSLLDETEVQDMRNKLKYEAVDSEQENVSINNNTQSPEPLNDPSKTQHSTSKENNEISSSNQQDGKKEGNKPPAKQLVRIISIEEKQGSADSSYLALTVKDEQEKQATVYAVNTLANNIRKAQPKKDEAFYITTRKTAKGFLLTTMSKAATAV
ncbi:hypothetical protein [Pseudobacillus badius]|uniref:hypothetical protein n=1 Tax=Bacillus badius TaxID=1455 RepID=UPI003D34FB16